MLRVGTLLRCTGSLLLLASVAHAGQPHMTVDPDFLGFDPTVVGSPIDTRGVTISNADPKGSSLSVTSVALTAGDTSDFAWSCDGGGQACIPGQVQPGASMTVFVTFTPTVAGTRSATLTVTGNDLSNPSEAVALSGLASERIFANDFEPGTPKPFSSCTGCTDIIPPGEVDLFEYLMGGTPGTVDLAFTAPHEDGASGGAVWSYELRYSASDITSEVDWQNATEFPLTLIPSAPGNTDGVTVFGLAAGGFYYFSIRAYDEVGNLSALSPARFVQAGE